MVEARLQADRSRSTNLDESYRYALRLTRSTARNFAYSFWFLTPERRRSIAAVYAYSRRLDDCVDSAEEGTRDKAAAWQALERHRALLTGGEDDPLAPALRDTIRRFSIPLEPFHDLIAGMEMDLEHRGAHLHRDLRQ